VRRTHHTYRLAAVGQTGAEIAELLDAFLHGESSSGLTTGKKPAYAQKLVWVFSGQGSHWAGMGRALLEREPIFAAALRRCDALFQQHAGWSLEAALDDEARLNETDVAQPLIFAVQVALAALWRSWGIVPDTIVGHSLGEVAAAHVAGALSLADAVQVVYHRCRLMKRVAGLGKTAAVELTLEQAQLMLIGREDLLAVAGSNSPTSCILSGDPAELSRVLASLERQNIFCRMLRGVDIAFHSAQMDPLKAELVAALAQIQPQPTVTPLISTVTGALIDGSALDATYWGRNLREPFLFAEAVRELLQQDYTTFLEVSPHPVLAESILRSGKHFNYPVTVIASLRRNRDDSQSLLEALGSLYTLGAPIAWSQVAGAGRCVPLPQYPWQRERYWLDQLLPERAEGYSFDSLIARLGAKTTAHSETRRADAHPLLASYLRASITGQHFWESALSTTLVPYLRDHQVQGLTVLPGSAYIEMGLVAAAALGDSYRLCDVEFKQALFVPQTEPCNIQMAVSPGADGRSSFQIASTRPSEHGPTSWIVNASGALEPSARKGAPANLNGTPQQIQARCTELISDAEHYEAMQSYKLMYGPQFRAINGIWRRDGEALGQLCLPAETAHESGSYLLHPVLLDAAFQVVAATLPRGDRSDDTFLPQGMRSVELYTTPATRIWCHAILRSSLEEDVDRHEADLWLLDENGQVVAEVQGLQLQRLGAATPHDSLARLDDWLYSIDWQPLSAAPTPIAGGSWLIFADDGGVGQQLAEVLRAQGVETLLVYREHGLAQRNNVWGIDPSNREDWQTLAQAVAGRSQSPYQNIVYLWALDATPSDQLTLDGLQADQSLCFGNIVRLVQSLVQVERQHAPRLWLITVGSQAIDAAHNPLGITQAPVWGLGRVLMCEHPELRTTLIDLDPTLPGMSVSTLLEALAQADAEDQIGYRQGQRYVARLATAATSAVTQPLRWRTDGSYLITGGLGGLGLEVARWMAQQGARRLILLGRTPLPPRASWHQYTTDSRAGHVIAAVRQLEAMGVAVHVVALDISDAAQLSAYLDTYRREGWPPIRGVVHAAGVLHDQLLAHTDESAIVDVLQPKITGTWLLHHLLQDQPLDFFVLFSSLASALGSVGQSSYAAGNAFMDALAHYRHTLGQPAISINWGPWAEVGMAARSGVNMHMAEQGIRPLLATQGTAVLHRLLQSAAAQTTALVIDWSRWFRANPSARSKPLLANLLETALPDSAATAGTATWTQELAQAAVETQQTLLEEHLLTLTAKVLRVQRDRLPLDQPLHIFGIDSIMSIELRNSIEATTEIQLAVAYLLEGPSITTIAAEILSQLRSLWVQDLLTASEDSAIDDQQALALLQTQIDQEHDDRIAHLLDQLEHLSAEEVAVLLKDM
ncbi:MAG: SDR family NAD(P)-dependent oxidoreductase, partial [Chloroflexi bacterium]|nr:SDR family NAD(P)-dependent oxidoreductase [Chloroflexota bacterium]